MLDTYEILLASGSPRRAELLKGLGLNYSVVESGHADEEYPDDLSGGEIARYLADHKSDAYKEVLGEDQILMTADTIVWHKGKELGKPGDREEAIEMINSLSGASHKVFTGVCLRSRDKRTSFYSETEVKFSHLEEKEVAFYVDRFRPFDKAGAYGIQEWIGFVAVEHIVGSYFNVMGLPVQRVYSELKIFTDKLERGI